MRTVLTALILTANIMSAAAQQTVADVLSHMPKDLMPYVSDDQREQIGRFATTGNPAEMKNTLEGVTTIRVMADDFAQITMNESTDMQVKLLPANDTTRIVCVIKTVKSALTESVVTFYSEAWEPINQTFGLPDMSDADAMIEELTQRPDTMTEARFEELRAYIEPVAVSAEMPDGGDTIIFRLNIPFASKEEKESVKAIIRQKSLKWNGHIFKKC